MLELSRTVRFCLNDDDPDAATRPPSRRTAAANTFSAWPAMRGLSRYYELIVRCRGQADPQTGYFINIRHIDQAVRDHVLPHLDETLARPTHAAELPMGQLMQQMIACLQPPLAGTVVRLTFCLTPRYHLAIESQDMEHVLIQQQYEFSAAHRLHVPELGDQQNQQIFGKCNNPAGHGHNYQLAVTVRVPINPTGRVMEVHDLDTVVNQQVIERLDHKHLNIDVPAFAELNPSVEHIAQVIWQMLADPIAAMDARGRIQLEEISVWETGKTVCTYRGPADTAPSHGCGGSGQWAASSPA